MTSRVSIQYYGRVEIRSKTQTESESRFDLTLGFFRDRLGSFVLYERSNGRAGQKKPSTSTSSSRSKNLLLGNATNMIDMRSNIVIRYPPLHTVPASSTARVQENINSKHVHYPVSLHEYYSIRIFHFCMREKKISVQNNKSCLRRIFRLETHENILRMQR